MVCAREKRKLVFCMQLIKKFSLFISMIELFGICTWNRNCQHWYHEVRWSNLDFPSHLKQFLKIIIKARCSRRTSFPSRIQSVRPIHLQIVFECVAVLPPSLMVSLSMKNELQKGTYRHLVHHTQLVHHKYIDVSHLPLTVAALIPTNVKQYNLQI